MRRLLAALVLGGSLFFGAVNAYAGLGTITAFANNGTHTTIRGFSIKEPLVYGESILHNEGIPVGTRQMYYGTTTTLADPIGTETGAIWVGDIYDSKIVTYNIDNLTMAGTASIYVYGAIGSTTNNFAVIGSATSIGTASGVIDVSAYPVDWISVGVVCKGNGTCTPRISGHYINYRR